MKNLPVALLAIAGFAVIFWPTESRDVEPTPDPEPVVETDILDKADDAYRQELARLVLEHSGSDWTSKTMKDWSDDVAKARQKTHSEVMDRLAKGFADGNAAEMVEPIRNGVWK